MIHTVNISKDDTFVDFLGDKAGARLAYGGQFDLTSGETLETVASSHEIPNMYLLADADFIRCCETCEKNRSYIDNILPTMQLLEALYSSSDKKCEISF